MQNYTVVDVSLSLWIILKSFPLGRKSFTHKKKYFTPCYVEGRAYNMFWFCIYILYPQFYKFDVSSFFLLLFFWFKYPFLPGLMQLLVILLHFGCCQSFYESSLWNSKNTQMEFYYLFVSNSAESIGLQSFIDFYSEQSVTTWIIIHDSINLQFTFKSHYRFLLNFIIFLFSLIPNRFLFQFYISCIYFDCLNLFKIYDLVVIMLIQLFFIII